ncbi:MAG: 4Fe-4S dicluster domain-containing protein [Planctomycetaceae bacterium]|nr:4Fe-4S dicluster domain-containing protein [Planctomycetaceae bacterium]
MTENVPIETRSPPLPVVGSSIPYERFLDCVHCGLCTSSCPTYVETGNENDSPRGRIYLMRAVVDGRTELTDKVQGHLDLCLDCRSCETACPSGVQYGRLLEPFRIEMHNRPAAADSPAAESRKPDWFHRYLLYGLFPDRVRMARALIPARWAQILKLDRLAEVTGLTKLLPNRLRRMQAQLPRLNRPAPPLPDFLPAKGERRAVVGLFLGCVADAMFRHVHWATARVLQENGCDVVIPQSQVCCGAIHYHSGSSGPTLDLMETNIASFAGRKLDAVIANVAGCGAMLKDYAHIEEEIATDRPQAIRARTAEFTQTVCDISEFLVRLGPIAPSGQLPLKVAYQDACHLQHAQRIREQPRQLLTLIPGVTLQEIAEPELCCGAAGSYNLTQPEMSDRLGDRKISNLLDAEPDVIVSANAGCSLQLQARLKTKNVQIPVVHPMELLDLSYRGQSLNALGRSVPIQSE